jgi:hypothetical protein
MKQLLLLISKDIARIKSIITEIEENMEEALSYPNVDLFPHIFTLTRFRGELEALERMKKIVKEEIK